MGQGTRSFTDSLPLQTALSGVILLGLFVYQLAWVCATLLITSLYVSPNEQNTLLQFARRGLLGKFIGFLVLLVSTLFKLVAACAQALLLIIYSLLPLVMIGLVFAIIEGRWGDSAIMFTSTLNSPNSTIAQTLQIVLKVPMFVLNLLAYAVLPFYNLLVYIFFSLPLEIIVHFFIGKGGVDIGMALISLGKSAPLLFSAGASYVQVNHVVCPVPEPTCWNSTSLSFGIATCQPVDSTTVASICLNPQAREFDFQPTLNMLMQACTYFLKGIAVGCDSLQTFLNIFFFPITDKQLWQALHSFLNAIMYMAVGTPTTTAARCALAGGFAVRPAMCTPDFGPGFDYAVNAMQHLGAAIDNFLDMTYLLVFYGPNAQCPSSGQTTNNNNNPMNFDWTLDPIALSLFGSNSTVLVALSFTTDTLWAMTDGQNAVYIKYTSDLRRSYYPNLWGSTPVDPRYGIAALEDGSMMGCQCMDTQNGLVVQCTVVNPSSSPTAEAFNTSWEIASAPELLKCESVRILVQSIRWPQNRVLYAEQLAGVPPPSSTLLAADAAIYVIPSCGGKASTLLACINPAVLTLSNCFPFCMGLHFTSSTIQQDQPSIILRGYDSWTNGVLVTARDCVPLAVASQNTNNNMNNKITSHCSSDAVSSNPQLANAASASSFSSSVSCGFSGICTSFFSNKSTYANGDATYHASIPAFADTSTNVAMVLQGQPIVAAGGVVMRLAKEENVYYMDFPVLTGNQYNEFTMEVASPVGIPVAPLATVISNGGNLEGGYIEVPPTDIEMVDIYNPATLTTDALWYAVNPSYDWLFSMAKYCASKGQESETSISFLSSYAAIQIWKVYYQESACFIRAADNAHICRSDVASGFSLDIKKNIPGVWSQLLIGCETNTEYNLLVENMEYYDELNLVVSVRRGTIASLYYLMTAAKSTSSLNDVDLGYIVFYFVNIQNSSQVRENQPWTAAQAMPSVISGSAVMCPALRFMPSIGTFIAQSAASVLYGMKFVVNFIANPFALNEILASRVVGACPGLPLNHGVLMDCGMGLFSLDDFFNSIYAANNAFWDIVAWLASLLQGHNNANIQEIFESFLTGFATYGEASHIVSLYDVVDTVTVFDTGIEDSVVGGGELSRRRRHLLSYVSPSLNHTHKRKLLGFANAGRRVGKSLFTGLFRTFTGGFQKILSMGKSFSSAMALSATTADFSVLVATDNPTYILGSAITAPGIVWAQFTYETVVPIGLDLIANLLYNNAGGSFLNSSAVVWVHLQEAKDNYASTVESRLMQGCTGLRLMLGYSGGLPTAVYYNCLAAVDMHTTWFKILILITSEMPLYHCVCIQATGQPFPQYIVNHCMPWVPSSRKGLWQQLLYENGQSLTSICQWYGNYIHNEASHMLDQWTLDSTQAASSLGSFLQDLILPDAQTMGVCTTVESNPNVYTLLPIPSDHYQICGLTSLCQLRCADALALFYYELNNTSIDQQNAAPFSQQVSGESPFFNPYQSTSSSLYYVNQRIIGLTTRTLTSSKACATCPSTGSCLTTITTPWTSSNSYTVISYCIPPSSAIKATVYATGLGNWVFSLPSTEATLTYCNMALQQDDLYVLLAFSSASVSISQSGAFAFSSSNLKTATLQQLYAVWYDESNVFKQPQQAMTNLLLDTSQISNLLLTQTIQNTLFDPSQKVSNTQVTQCSISSLVELASGVRGQLLFFLSITFSAQGYSQTNANALTMASGVVFAILQWSDPVYFGQQGGGAQLQLFVPCPCPPNSYTGGGGPPPSCPDPQSQKGCRPGLDSVLYLAQLGTFLYVESNLYLHIPADTQGGTMPFQYVKIDPSGNQTLYPVSPPESLKYPGGFPTNNQIFLSQGTKMGPSPPQSSDIGSWTQADVFALSGLGSRQVRSPVIQNVSNVPIRWLQSIQSSPASVQWFMEMRLLLTQTGFQLKGFQSQNVTTQATFTSNCTPSACSGCASSRLRLTCHVVQDCMINRCIGTMVNSQNLLCSIGIVVEQVYLQMVTSWRAIYMIMVEIVMFVLNGFGGSLPQNIVFAFPTDQFYSLVCSCKDVYASAIGMAMGFMQSIQQLLTTGSIDLTIQTSFSLPQVSLASMQIQKLGSFAFNLIANSTLYPLLALHRWLLCVIQGELAANNNSTNVLTVQFGDVSMDSSWGVCSPLANDFSVILDASQLGAAIQGSVDSFLSYTVGLLSGIGDTVLYALLLMYDSLIGILVSMVWCIQGIMYAFNPSQCNLSDYTQNLVLQCECGDTPYSIPQPQRSSTWNHGGALWCSGSLSMTLVDGSQGVIFNPYSLDELSSALVGMTSYIQCLSTSPSNVQCQQPPFAASGLSVLSRQNVEPIAVWAKCKSNYLLQSWDSGAGALFSNTIVTTGVSQDVYSQITVAQKWASSISPDFLNCLAAPERFNVDYTVCMTMFMNLTMGKLPNAYYLYAPQNLSMLNEPPDACLVFSGLKSSSSVGSPLKETMQNCMMDTAEAEPTLCQFNPSIWSASSPANVPVAKLFGTTSPQETTVAAQYHSLSQQIMQAFSSFNKTFPVSAKQMKVDLFSVDGDFIHDFLDCVFLGPYTRVDMLPCDWNGRLECPFYARDELGGVTREFTACYGPVMHGDTQLPFTCGSQARRALIKYFIRDFCFRNDSLHQEITQLIQTRVLQLMQNLTNPASYGCLNQSTGQCSPSACTQQNAFAPCIDMDFTISSSQVSQLLLKDLLSQVDEYYAFVMQDTMAWTKYYNESGEPPFPAQWGMDTTSANVGIMEAIFNPLDPVVQYDASEIYSMPSDPKSSSLERASGSIWSLCMGLVGQGMMSLPVVDYNDKEKEEQSFFRPPGTDIPSLLSFNFYDLDSVASMVKNITQHTLSQQRSPFLWHKARRHAPSPSAVCKKSQSQTFGTNKRIFIGPAQFQVPGVGGGTAQVFEVSPESGFSFPFHGFSWGMLGYTTCLCGSMTSNGDQCILDPEVCHPSSNASSLLPPCLQALCNAPSSAYPISELPSVWQCLHSSSPGIRCPELGPSDSWGLFPMDCSDMECQSAQGWIGNANQDTTFEGIRFVTEGRSGLKLPNYKHVNSTFQNAIHYGVQQNPSYEYTIPTSCFPSQNDLAKDSYTDAEQDTSVDNFVKGLFPALQLMFDSPVISHCSRFIVETARVQALSLLPNPPLAAIQDASQQVSLWRSKCHAKLRHLSSCSRLGVYYDLAPPPNWRSELLSLHCDVLVHPQWNDQIAYITPWCIAIHRIQRQMYNARLCLLNLVSPLERQNLASGYSSQHLLNTSDLVPSCLLSIQPLDLLSVSSPVSTTYTLGAQRLNNVQNPIPELSSSALTLEKIGLPDTQADHVSHILDWWPDNVVSMPVGYHVTAPMLQKELAPVGFDSHYAYDPSDPSIHYIHTALRDSDLLKKYLGAGGLCRAHSVGMPLFDANTNRFCTRSPLPNASYTSQGDSPHLPVNQPFTLPSLMGPYSNSWLAKKYGSQICASTAEEIPWAVTDEPGAAGDIPGVFRYFKMDVWGNAIYSYPQFPSPQTVMYPLRGLYTDWGDVCANSVHWGTSPSCLDTMTNSPCFKNSVCLRLQPDSPQGICYSIEAFRQDTARAPCFTSEQCDDGLVCLADGGCAPLYLHVWNNAENDIASLEFGVLANDCGFEQPHHPYTQSMRGASPWEQVPDLLHQHGMCSHRNWFAYRNALQDGVCSLASGNPELMECNTTTAVWPDIQMHFGGCRTSQTDHFNMSYMDTLQMVAHPCDVDYLHRAVHGQRLKVCSGYQGESISSTGYFSYPLNSATGTWENAVSFPSTSANATYWMRTYDEATDILHMGNLMTSQEYNNTLGFLGAEINSSNPVLSALASGNVNFFRCADRIAEQMPEFDFGGVTQDPRRDLNTGGNFSELSLRRCGSIGSLLLLPGNEVCKLDAELFPLFSYLAHFAASNMSRGCFSIWSIQTYLHTSKLVLPLPNDWQSGPFPQLALNPQSLFCSAGGGGPLCIYNPRTTSVLTDANKADGVAGIIQMLNNLFLDTTTLLVQLTASQGALLTYEDINLCAQSLWSYTETLQVNVQAIYKSAIPSGFYIAFKLSLFEFPQQWFHQCMLNILLNTLRSTPAPDTSLMASGTPIALDLWSDVARVDLCDAQLLPYRTGLFHIVCSQMHPSYTLMQEDIDLPEEILNLIQVTVLEHAQAQLYENQKSGVVECYTEAVWNLPSQMDTLLSFYGENTCTFQTSSQNFNKIGPCVNTSVYSFQNLQTFDIQEISNTNEQGTYLASFLSSSTESINQQASSLSSRIDYVTHVPGITSQTYMNKSGTTMIPIVQVQPIDTSLFTGFVDTLSWLNSVCENSLPDPYCPPPQSSMTSSDPCLVDIQDQYKDADRYLKAEEPAIQVQFANGTVISHPLCPWYAEEGISKFIYQTEYGYNTPDGENGGIDPAIIAVLAPPGIYLRAFTGTGTVGEWDGAIPAQSSINCAWTTLEQDGWWPGAVGFTSSSSFDDLGINFQDMTNGNWWPPGNTDWTQRGCGGYSAVIVLEYRLESSFFNANGLAQCDLTWTIPMTPLGFNIRSPVSCGNDEWGNPLRAFRVRDKGEEVGSSAIYSLWRCSTCTQYKVNAVAATTTANNVMFQCTLPGGIPLNNLFTESMLVTTFPFLYNAQTCQELLEQFLSLPPGWSVVQQTSLLLQIVSPWQTMGDLGTMSYWGGQNSDKACFTNVMWNCLAFNDGMGYDSTYISEQDQLIWNRAVNNPHIPFTMTSEGQQYTSRSEEYCNPHTDMRRQALAQFVESQYRETDGVWLQQVQMGWGTAFQANVAHSAVQQFTVFYASADRPPEQVTSSWVLGTGPCSSQATTLEDRICVESTLTDSRFEAVHPWVGGDFNPFMGLDQCPFQSQSECAKDPHGYGASAPTQNMNGVSMCSCTCSPVWACAGTAFNYSTAFMLKEFPQLPACQTQSYTQTKIMDSTDASNLCSNTVPQQSGGCSMPQGLLGGDLGSSITTPQLHSAGGIPDTLSENEVQELMDLSGDFTDLQDKNTLWTGNQGVGYLSMPRAHLHPAHIAFGLDSTINSMPLKVKAISLLPQQEGWEAVPSSWAQNLKIQWLAELKDGISSSSSSSIYELYPQLDPARSKKNSSATTEGGQDWSCPIRKLVFWGSSTPEFGPVTPNPVVAELLYNLSGVHPLIKPQGPYPYRADYYTTNGFCYYKSTQQELWPFIDVGDMQSPCGLRGMLYLLDTSYEAGISIQEPFASRCNDIIDTPDAGGQLRSGETLPVSDLQLPSCGLLHRLTPALVAVRGDTVGVTAASEDSSSSLNTSSEGGDCHMGRLSRIPIGKLQGHQCATTSKTQDNIQVYCPYNASSSTSFPRTKPLTLSQLLDQSTAVVYRSDYASVFPNGDYPVFKGPARSKLADNEISFGQLYSASLKEMLSDDLLQYATSTPLPPWTGSDFWDRYLNGSLVKATENNNNNTSELFTTLQQQNKKQQRLQTFLAGQAQAKDQELWNATDWTWSFLNHSAPPQGSVPLDAWLADRAGACNASMESLLAQGNIQAQLQNSVRRIALCAPPLTGDLSTLCTTMTQFAVDVTQANCQMMGKGDCISNLGMFYLPYQWSSTNQAYSFTTVSQYYQNMLTNYFSNESYLGLCHPTHTILQTLAKLSVQQNAICPATGLDLLKTMLSDLRAAGDDLLFLTYNYVMMVANFIAAMFTLDTAQAGVYLNAATEYMAQLLVLVKQFLIMMLDVVVQLLMYISTLGKAIKDIVVVLCTFYNWVLDYLISTAWCAMVRPVIIGVLKAVQVLAFMSSSVVSSIQNLLNTIGDGDVASCIASFQSQATAQCPTDANPTYNNSQFQPQALATMCWSQAQGGGGIFTGGGATDALLTCTASDTCAVDPLLFDAANGLVYCGSCPALAEGVDGYQFGCDIYLQRCVCGTQVPTKSECLNNADCEQNQAMCAIGSDVNTLRSSMLSTPCSSCGTMSMNPTCILDGQGLSGICGCANVVSNLLSCTPAQLGTRSLIGYTSQLCPVVTDASQRQMLENTVVPQSISIDFSNLAVASCNLGTFQNLCLNVEVPFFSSSTASGAQNPYVVLITQPAQNGGRRRHLLSFSRTDSLLADYSSTGQQLADDSFFFNDWIQHHYHNTTTATGDASSYCIQAKQNQNREALKQCLYWTHLGTFVTHHFNLTDVDGTQLFSPETGVLYSLGGTLGSYVWRNPNLLTFLVGHMPYGQTLLNTAHNIQKLWNVFYYPRHQNNITRLTRQSRSLLQSVSSVISFGNNEEDQVGNYSTNPTNGFLVATVNTGDWNFNCSTIEVPLQKITGAFWDTVAYYSVDAQRVENVSVPVSMCNLSEGISQCIGYTLPPPSSASSTDTLISKILLYIPTLGMGGNRVMDAVLSPMSYQEAEQNDYVTGQRILQDMGTCNFTRLTLGPEKQRNFLAILVFLVCLFTIISYACIPCSFCGTILWYLLFPIVLLWSLYNISPLCWPMIPPRLISDVNAEITTFLPDQLTVPKYLVEPRCTVDGRLSDGTYDPSCFISCTEPPFLFKSWQDTLTWWLCEASTSACRKAGASLENWTFFNDLVSSADYYADVIQYSYKDPSLVQAHRLCAFLSLYNVVFLVVILLFSCYVIPLAFSAFLEIFSGSLLLVLEIYNMPNDDASSSAADKKKEDPTTTEWSVLMNKMKPSSSSYNNKKRGLAIIMKPAAKNKADKHKPQAKAPQYAKPVEGPWSSLVERMKTDAPKEALKPKPYTASNKLQPNSQGLAADWDDPLKISTAHGEFDLRVHGYWFAANGGGLYYRYPDGRKVPATGVDPFVMPADSASSPPPC